MNTIYLLLIHDSPYGWTADKSWAERWAQSHQDRGWSAITHYPSPEEHAGPLMKQIPLTQHIKECEVLNRTFVSTEHPLGKPVRH